MGGQRYMDNPSRVLLEFNYNLDRQFSCTTANSTPIRVVTKEVRYIHALSLTLEHSMPIRNMMVQATQGLDRLGPQILRNTLRPIWFVLPW